MLSAWLGANSITPQHPRYDPKTLRLAVLLVPAAYSVSFRQDFVGQTEAPLIGRYLSNRSKAAPAVLPPAQRTIDRWRTFVLAILVLASVFARPGNISAQGFYYPGNVTAPGWWYWVPLEIGCARSIAVGPNGVPWVLGCEDGPNGTGPARVYYLSYSNQDSLIPYQWDYDNFSAMTLSVNLQGVPNARGRQRRRLGRNRKQWGLQRGILHGAQWGLGPNFKRRRWGNCKPGWSGQINWRRKSNARRSPGTWAQVTEPPPQRWERHGGAVDYTVS
jgi:hypothetical protein